MIGTVTTKHGLVHEVVAEGPVVGVEYTSRLTTCRRTYVKTPLDEPAKVVTCVWCLTNKRWPEGVRVGSHNPCAEVWLPQSDDT